MCPRRHKASPPSKADASPHALRRDESRSTTPEGAALGDSGQNPYNQRVPRKGPGHFITDAIMDEQFGLFWIHIGFAMIVGMIMLMFVF